MAGDKGEFMRVMVNPAVYGVLKYISRGGGGNLLNYLS